MLIIDRSVITDGGAALLNSGDPINITSVKTGSGTYTSSEDIKSRTALKSTQYSYAPSSVTVDGVTRTVNALLSNYDPVTEQAIVTTDYTLTEVGLFATVNGSDVLFAIGISYDGSEVPAFTGQNKSEIVIGWDMAVSGTDAITITATGAPALATDLNAHVGTLVLTNSGVHGIRAVKNGDDITLQVNDGGTWKDIAGGGTTIVPIPVQDTSATYTYDGTAQSIAWITAPTSDVLVTNGTATNAGTYTCTCALKDAHDVWGDLSTGDKTFTWTIGKGTPTLTLSPSSISFDKNHTADVSLSVTTDSDGTVTLSGYDSNLITVSGASSPYTVATSQTTGTTTITVSVAASQNYFSTSDTVSVTNLFTNIYGVSWDGTSTTSWTRTDAAASFVDPVPYVAGATNYSSPFDDKMPWSGMTKSYYGTSGNAVVAIPKFWYKITQNGAGIKIQIADDEIDGFSVSPAHMDRGDGSGERDVVYIGRYACGPSYDSAPNQAPANNIARSTARAGIHQRANFWQMDYAMLTTIQLLFLVEFANWNARTTIGHGGGSLNLQNSGYTDSMPYHTGTMFSSRATAGVGTQYRNIEGLWDNIGQWYDGCYYSSNKLYVILNPSNFGDTGGIEAGTVTATQSTIPKSFVVNNPTSGFPLFLPTAWQSTTNYDIYSCSRWWNQYTYLYGGYSTVDNGLFFMYSANESQYIGCRLMVLP